MAIVDLAGTSTITSRTLAALEVDHPSEKYLHAILQLLPRGSAWTRRLGSVLARLLHGVFADEALRIEQRWRGLVEEADPNTTFELLDDWERVLALPDICYAPTGTADRQAALVAKIANREGPHSQHFIDLAADVGFGISLVRSPYPRLRCDDRVDQRLNTGGWHAVFRVLIDSFGASNDLLVCVLNAAKRLQSYCQVYKPIGTDWSLHTAAAADYAYGLAWDRLDLFVMVGTVSSAKITTSHDGKNWTARTPPGGIGNLRGVCHNLQGLSPLWCAVGTTGTVITSPDGVTWAQETSGTTDGFLGVATDGATWVAVGLSGAIHISTDDCTSWSDKSDGTANLHSVCHGPSLFVLVGDTGTIKTSPDGVTWTTRTPDASFVGLFSGICWTGTNYVAVGHSGEIQTSPDGTTWTQRSTTGNSLRAVCHNFETGQTFAVGDSGATSISDDHGVTWTPQITSGNRWAAACSRDRLIAGSVATHQVLVSEEGEY